MSRPKSFLVREYYEEWDELNYKAKYYYPIEPIMMIEKSEYDKAIKALRFVGEYHRRVFNMLYGADCRDTIPHQDIVDKVVDTLKELGELNE